MGEAYRWVWVAGSTLLGVDTDGNPILTLSPAYLHDDREALRIVAETAYQWYSLERRTLAASRVYDSQVDTIKLGDHVSGLVQGSDVLTINGIITQMQIQSQHFEGDEPRKDLSPMTWTIQTSFGELDFTRL